MSTAGELEKYLGQRYGDTGILVNDPLHPQWMRQWDHDDTRALCDWFKQQGEDEEKAGRDPDRIGYNIEQTAALMGVGTHTVQGWIRREDRPLPHLRDGRRIIIPHFLLLEWLREEAEHSRTATGPREG